MATIGESVESVVAVFNGKPGAKNATIAGLLKRHALMDSKVYQNSSAFVREFIKNDPKFMLQIMFDHASQNWEDVVATKLNVPTASQIVFFGVPT